MKTVEWNQNKSHQNDNKKFGTNALDAVSSLELFQTAINETKLVSWDRQNVFILIGKRLPKSHGYVNKL